MATFCVHGIALTDDCDECRPSWMKPDSRPIHDPNEWTKDRREILAARVPDHPSLDILLPADGWTFQRFERNGELAPVPFLRAVAETFSIEAPVREWKWIEFAKEPVA